MGYEKNVVICSKKRLHEAQEKANMLFKKSKATDEIMASYYEGIWEALVWMQFDIENDLFAEN